MHTQIGLRIGVADSGHFDGFRVPLSSALFCIHLVTRYFLKITEDRSMADMADRYYCFHPCSHPTGPSRESELLSHEFRALPPAFYAPLSLQTILVATSSSPFLGSVPIQCESRALSPGESAYPAHSSDSVVGRRSKRPGRGRQVFSPHLPTRYPVTYDI